ncbi:MAG TPA: ABC transporter permease [bacterium]|nr:ABC transporter permease [bacterium]
MGEELKQSLSLAWRALMSNKVRSFLTMLGIVIGVAAVIIIISIGNGAQSLILDQLKSFGKDLVIVLPGNSDEGPPSEAMGITITTLKYNDAEALSKPNNVANVKAVVAYYQTSANVIWRGNSYETAINGVTANYFDVEDSSIDKGRFFTNEEVNSAAHVAVLGSVVVDELFGDVDPIGQRLRIKNQTVEVIGVLKSRGKVGMQDYDDQILVPVVFAQKMIAGVDYLSSIRVKLVPNADADRAVLEIEETLREQHNILKKEDDDFSVHSFQDVLDTITRITNTINYFLATMAGLSLVVGGIGIMNIMLVSVTERTREIGLRKAIGATNGQILRQFLLESVCLTLIGGSIGIISGVLVSYLAAVVAHLLRYQWDFVISIPALLIAVLISIAIGIIFGLYPARRASNLEPVDALRYE